MTQGRKSQRYLSGRSKIIGFSGLSSDRHLYVEPGQVEPNLGFPGEKNLPLSDTYYKLVTIADGNTFDRYWQEDAPSTLEEGISIFDEGTLVGTANSVSKINFVGSAITAIASGTISTITVSAVSISTEAPSGANHGDLWWDSDDGELNVYYQDVNTAQWVVANSGLADSEEGGTTTRTTANASTSSIVNDAYANIEISASKSYVLHKIQTSAAAWVTLYTDSTSRSNDSSRSQGTDPTPNSGVIAEAITTGAATQIITPGLIGWNNDGTPSTSVYLKVVNKSGSTQAITVTLHYLPLES